MYELVQFGDELILARNLHPTDVYEPVVAFTEYTHLSKRGEVWQLAREMRDVLNRDLENRSLDIANTLNAPTCDQVNGIPFRNCPGCDVCNSGKGQVGEEPPYGPPGSLTHALAMEEKLTENDMPDNWKPLSERTPGFEKEEWPIDPETGTPKVGMVGEVKDFPEPTNAKWDLQVDGPLRCDVANGVVVLGCPGCELCLPKPAKEEKLSDQPTNVYGRTDSPT